MAHDSFGQFVQALDKAGELKRVSQPIATELEITALADREMKSPGGGQALLIEQPTVNGRVSPFPVAINTLGSHQRMALSMGAGSVEEAARELGALLKAKPPVGFEEAIKLLGLALDLRHAKPKLVSEGACQEVVLRAAELASGAREASPTSAFAFSLHPFRLWPPCPFSNAGRWMRDASSPCLAW